MTRCDALYALNQVVSHRLVAFRRTPQKPACLVVTSNQQGTVCSPMCAPPSTTPALQGAWTCPTDVDTTVWMPTGFPTTCDAQAAEVHTIRTSRGRLPAEGVAININGHQVASAAVCTNTHPAAQWSPLKHTGCVALESSRDSARSVTDWPSRASAIVNRFHRTQE